jgi:hypothetical protein
VSGCYSLKSGNELLLFEKWQRAISLTGIEDSWHGVSGCYSLKSGNKQEARDERLSGNEQEARGERLGRSQILPTSATLFLHE